MEIHTWVTMPRCLFKAKLKPVKVQIHGFSDSSDLAYAAVLYMRSIYDDGSVEVRVIAAKTKVTPLKKQSIPRLELLGALTLARLSNTVLPLLPNPKELYLWVDSTTVLYWIRNDKIWKQNVQHQVEEICQLTCHESWRHCPGSINPADLPSRGVDAQELFFVVERPTVSPIFRCPMAN